MGLKVVPLLTLSLRPSTVLRGLVDLGLAHGLAELALELAGHAADLRHGPADRAQHARQLLRPDDDERHRTDEDEFCPTDIEHELPIIRQSTRTGIRACPSYATRDARLRPVSRQDALADLALDRRRPARRVEPLVLDRT